MSESTPPTTPDRLDGRTALVTGGSRNLGAEIARTLADRGARVVLTYQRAADEAEQVRASLPTVPGSEHHAVMAELGTPTGADDLVERLADLEVEVDVLVNNAGPFELTPLSELTTDRFDEVWRANLGAARTLAARLSPTMRSRGWGRIVNLSAGSAYVRNHSVYTLAKAAVEVLTEQLAVELGPEVTVNAVAPGQIAESADEVSEIDPTFVDRSIEATPLGRLVTRSEVADLVAALCSPLFGGVTGVTIPIDGGWRLPRF